MKKIATILFLLNSFFISAQVDSVDYYRQKATSFEFKSFDSMYHYAIKIRNVAEQSKNPLHQAVYHEVVGVALEETGFFDSALYHQFKSMEYAEAVGDSVLLGVALEHIGVIYKDLSLYDKSTEYLLKSMKISEQYQDWYTLAMANNCMSEVNHRMGNYVESMAYADREIAIGEAHDLPMAVSGGKIERANSAVMLGKFDEAIRDLLTAEKILLDNDNRDGIGSIYNTIGAVYFFKSDYNQAIFYYTKAENYFKESGDGMRQTTAVMNIGEAYIYLQEYAKSEQNLKQALQKYKSFGNKDRIVDAYQYLLDLEYARNDYQQALEYLKLKHSYRDSILNEQTLAKINDLKIQYETEKKEQELELLSTKNELQEAEIEQTRLLMIAVLIFAILLIIGILLTNSRKRYKLKAALAEEKERLQKNRFKMVIDAEEKERKRIAQELHDGLGQLLSTARITVSSLEQNPKVENSLKVIDMAVKEVRSISHNMMPNALVNVGLKAALEDVMRKVNESGSIEGVFDWPDEIQLNESQSISLYRIAQELINNALKYANASQVKLGVHQKDGFIMMTVTDNGTGFDTSTIDQSTGIGWANIQSRVDLLNGHFEIYSSMQQGTTTKISIKNPVVQMAG